MILVALVATVLSGCRPAPPQASEVPFPVCAAPASKIACENRLAGAPASQWDVPGSGDSAIQGFATDISVNVGQTVHFKIATSASAFHADIYRMGYYGGSGARRVATILPSVRAPIAQPPCLQDGTTGLIDCGNWSESAAWNVPAKATSGVYFARLARDDGIAGASHLVFVVRDDAANSDILAQTSDTTWQAYNDWGGRGLYTDPRAQKVSYNRPFTTRTAEGGVGSKSWVFNAEYPMVRWLESNGYDVTYTSGVDTARAPTRLLAHKVFLAMGHDEYWSAEQRSAMDAARDAGVNLAMFSGGVGTWKTRWDSSIDGSATPYRTLVTYKETLANTKTDPDPRWTGFWRDPRFSPPSDGGRAENATGGQLSGGILAVPLTVSAQEGRLRLWRNTSAAALAPGSSAAFTAGTVGYEEDFDLDNGQRPVGLMQLATTPMPPWPSAHVTMYRAGSGALVFAAGTVQWSWGLEWHHDGGISLPSTEMRQATVNVLADMGVQPATLQPGLVAALRSTDSVGPVTTFTTSGEATRPAVGSRITVSGTASDVGGAVAAVEVSTDGGATWHPAAGRGEWSYSWVPTDVAAPVPLAARAVDDSGNLGPVTAAVGATVVARNCPCSLWGEGVVPNHPDDGDPTAREVGVRFRSDADGVVTAVRYYKSTANAGVHQAHLWAADGTLLGTATFSGESASGWQEVRFKTAVPIAAGVNYVVSYHTDSGHVAADPLYFDDWVSRNNRGFDSVPLHALWSRDPAGPNGVVHVGASAFPSDPGTARLFVTNSNYWVDVVVVTGVSVAGEPPTDNGSHARSGSEEDRSAPSNLVELLLDGRRGGD